MELDELELYKNRMMRKICSNPEVVKLITGSSDAPVPGYDLIYTHVFPYEYIPDTVDEGDTFVCFDVDVSGIPSKTFLEPTIYVYVFTHKSNLRLPEGGLRLERLIAAIHKDLNMSREFGLGEIYFDELSGFVPAADFRGKMLVYSAREFNRSTSRKPPANRRTFDEV